MSPGAICWTLFLLGYFLPASAAWYRISEDLGLKDLFWVSLIAAVVTALISLVLYGKTLGKPKPSIVLLNLCINLSGLAFIAVGVVLGLVGRVLR